MGPSPRVFLSYASEDRAIAERLATDMRTAGVDVFFAEWEIRPGDSIRAKIDQGLSDCTHFVVLLTISSIGKPWVNAEIDAGFVRRVEDSCRFIPLRLGLSPNQLPPLLRGLHSPTLDDYDRELRSLLGQIFDLTLKPPLGSLKPVFAAPPAVLGVSTAAARVLEVLVRESVGARRADPRLEHIELQGKTDLTAPELELAVDELQDRGLVHILPGSSKIGSEARLFAEFDEHFMPWIPGEDAQVLVAALVNTNRTTVRADAIAAELGWDRRRINPALTYLLDRGLISGSQEVQPDWITVQFWLETRARRWLNEVR